jgi:hypothetical protein
MANGIPPEAAACSKASKGKRVEAAFRYLAQAEGHVIQGMEHIVRQHEIISDLEARGQDTTQAEEFLDRLEQTQALHVARRDKLRRELGQPGQGTETDASLPMQASTSPAP